MEYTLEFLTKKIKEVESVLNSLDENQISGTPERLQELKNTYSKQHIDLLCGIKFLEKKVDTSESGLNLCSVINCAFKSLPYVVLQKGKAVKKGRCFDYYKCNQFKLISLYFIHIRLCPTKQHYLDLPQAG